MEAVIGRVVEDLHAGMELAELVHVRHRDVHVLVAEMHLDRHLGRLVLGAVDAAAIVGRDTASGFSRVADSQAMVPPQQ